MADSPISLDDAAVKIVALGGLGEIGMNCLAIEQGGEILIVDCGVTFDDRGLGVDVIHPDWSALEPYAGHIRGIFLTHGHEDHIGAVPHFLKRFDVPVFGPRYALELLRERADEHEVLRYAELITVKPREEQRVGPFVVEPIRVTHSTIDSTALAIHTRAGLVVHTGDFKFDDSPPDGEAFDVDRLRALGDDGVRLLMSDSTNVDVPEASGSEEAVREVLYRLILGSTGRVIVGLFASNVHRLRLLAEIAAATGRRLVPLGRSVSTHARVAQRMGYLSWPETLTMPAERASELHRHQVLGVATGTQAEANAALARLARGEHAMNLEAGDHVILSSRVIPGHEPAVSALESAFLRRDIRVTTRSTEPQVHVSGHASRREQTRMIDLVRPGSFVPLHGTLHHLTRHAELARSMGVTSALVVENGAVAVLERDNLTQVGRWPSGRVHLGSGRPVAGETLRERSSLAAEGVIFAAVPVAEGRVVGPIELVARGVLPEPTLAEVLRDAAREAELSAMPAAGALLTDATLREAVRLAVRRVVARALGTKTQVIVTIVPVARARGSP